MVSAAHTSPLQFRGALLRVFGAHCFHPKQLGILLAQHARALGSAFCGGWIAGIFIRAVRVTLAHLRVSSRCAGMVSYLAQLVS